MKKIMKLQFCFVLVTAGFIFETEQMQAQQIIIDKSVKAGDLTLFPEMGNENVYYYLPDQLRLAIDDNGKPQFSFLKYVENTRSAPGAKDIREGDGGGIVHAVVSLAVTPEQLGEAKNALHQINSEGTIHGPVIYNGGTMTIVSSFTNPEGELTKQVVGIGRAPLIDGQKAAVSMELTKKGAKILWESFKTPTPDMSFSFEMELSGYRAPKKAIIEADFDKIYSHQGFQAGAAGNYGNLMFGGEIELAFDALRNDGAIKISNMGSDAEMDKLIESAYNKLTSMMFDPIGTGNPVVQGLMKGITGQKSALDRATDLYKKNNRTSVRKTPTKKPSGKPANKKTYNHDLTQNQDLLYASVGPEIHQLHYNAIFPAIGLKSDWEPAHVKEVVKDYIRLLFLMEEEKSNAIGKVEAGQSIDFGALSRQSNENPESLKKPKEYFRQFLLSDAEKSQYSKVLDGSAIPNEEFIILINERVCAIVYKQDFLNDEQKTYILDIAPPDTAVSWDKSLTFTYIAWLNRNEIVYLPEKEEYKKIAQKIFELRTKSESREADAPSGNAIAEKGDEARQNIKDALDSTIVNPSKKTGNTSKPITGGEVVGGKTASNKKTGSDKKQKKTHKDNVNKKQVKKKETAKKDFKMAVMASYQFKKITQKGRFKINLNKYTADKLVARFDENIGRVNCDQCFFEVNLDDPMFKQREIVAILDGFNYDDFGKYINYVNLKMRKNHQNGEVTMDEVRIDRDNFMKSANNFKLLYGWKGDDDRNRWFDYEVESHWSFFGGTEVAGNWEKVNTNIINLAAPYLRRTIELEGDPVLLKDKQVRSINVKIFYDIGEEEHIKSVSLLPSRDQYSSAVEVMMPKDNFEYDYEISWRMFGNKTKSSGRQTTSESILFVDEL